MKEEFVVILQKNRNLGWLLLPFIISSNDNQEFSTPTEFISIGQIDSSYSDFEAKIVKTINEYEERNITKLFSKKKKLSPKEFIDNIPEDLLENHIRPYIEKKMAKCIDLIREHDVPLFYKQAKSNLYPEDRIVVETDIPTTIFNFDKTSSGLTYNLSINIKGENTKLLDKKYILLSNSPCRIIIENTLYTFNDINGSKLLPFFKKPHIQVPEKFEKQYFETFILNSIKTFRVHANGFDIIENQEKPHIHLSIINNLQQQPALNIEFEYGNFKVNPNMSGNVLVTYNKNTSQPKYHKYVRDMVFEETIISELKKSNLAQRKDNLFVPKTKSENDTDLYNSILQWISKNNVLLNKYAIQTKNIDDKKFQNIGQNLTIEIKSYTDDWFDIHAQVFFGDYQIPFKRLRKYILNKQRILQLPNGELAIIPDEWFAQYKDLFLFDKETDKSESMKLHKFHFKVFQDNCIKPSSQIKKQLKSLNKYEDAELPKALNAELRSYQKDGYNWLYFLYQNKLGGCLADDMGLGKTLQTLTLLKKAIEDYTPINGNKTNTTPIGQLSLFDYNETNRNHKPPASLIVMPASLIHNWYNEIRKFTPSLKVYKYVGNVRNKGLHYFNKYDIVLTTYGLLRNDIESFEYYSFFYLILDESQVIKNPTSKIYGSVLRLKSDHKLVLTGTPIENSLTDLWAQMNFLNRDMLGSLNFFKKEFIKKIERDDTSPKERLLNIIKPFILRREKTEVAKDLPDLTEQVRVCKMNEDQGKYYESEKSKIRNLVYESIEKNGLNKSSFHILQALTKLRQIANHPGMIEDCEDMTSGKFDEVLRILSNLLEEKKHKILIFSSFVKQLDLFEKIFKESNIKYSLLTGETKNRENVISAFQEDSANKVFLISIKAGGVGLNLTAADYVFILDPWWNPAIENQAVSRAHRIGQKNKVFVYRFISEKTIEEKIRKLQEKKEELAKAFVNSENNFDFSRETVDFLLD